MLEEENGRGGDVSFGSSVWSCRSHCVRQLLRVILPLFSSRTRPQLSAVPPPCSDIAALCHVCEEQRHLSAMMRGDAAAAISVETTRTGHIHIFWPYVRRCGQMWRFTVNYIPHNAWQYFFFVFLMFCKTTHSHKSLHWCKYWSCSLIADKKHLDPDLVLYEGWYYLMLYAASVFPLSNIYVHIRWLVVFVLHFKFTKQTNLFLHFCIIVKKCLVLRFWFSFHF